MKIRVKAEKVNLSLIFPLSFLKSKLFRKMACKDNENMKKIFENRELMKAFIKELKKHKGLKLVEVISDDAIVKITI
mgnify:CR=1 FL=1